MYEYVSYELWHVEMCLAWAMEVQISLCFHACLEYEDEGKNEKNIITFHLLRILNQQFG